MGIGSRRSLQLEASFAVIHKTPNATRRSIAALLWGFSVTSLTIPYGSIQSIGPRNLILIVKLL